MSSSWFPAGKGQRDFELNSVWYLGRVGVGYKRIYVLLPHGHDMNLAKHFVLFFCESSE